MTGTHQEPAFLFHRLQTKGGEKPKPAGPHHSNIPVHGTQLPPCKCSRSESGVSQSLPGSQPLLSLSE